VPVVIEWLQPIYRSRQLLARHGKEPPGDRRDSD
jgi:hypothetical protein